MSKGFNFAKYQALVPAGREDLLTWSLLLGGAGINHPASDAVAAHLVNSTLGYGGENLGPALVITASVCAAAWGGSRLYQRWVEVTEPHIPISSFAKESVAGAIKKSFGAGSVQGFLSTWKSLRDPLVEASGISIRSSVELPSPAQWSKWDGMLLGYCVTTGEPVIVDWDHWMRHCFIIGQSGVGKTVLGEWLMLQQIVRGGSLLFMDGKMDEGNLKKINAMAAWAGRRDDLLVVNPGNPEYSNTYNPILFGDADEIASRVLSLIPSSESSPGADHYRQQASQAVSTLVNGIKSMPGNSSLRSKRIEGAAYNFFDLSMLLQNQLALKWLAAKIDPESPGGGQFHSWLEQFKIAGRDGGEATLDIKKMKDTFGGIGGRMHAFGTGNFGRVTASYCPEVKLFDALTKNKIVYVALPTMGKAEAASNFGKMVIGDYRTAVSWLQALPKDKRPWPPTLGFFDEAGSYVTQAWSRIFEQARSAHQVLMPAVQTVANLDAVSKELRAMVLGNTWTKVIFKLGEPETVQVIADLIGKEQYGVTSVDYGDGASTSVQAASAIQGSLGAAESRSVKMTAQEGYRVNPTTLAALGKGEAIVVFGNSKLYHIRIPMVEFTKDFYKEVGSYEVSRMPVYHVLGLDFNQNMQKFITQ